MEARDIMTKDIVALAPDVLVNEAADLLLRNRIHGAPVVDDTDQLVGMISFTDLAGRHGMNVGEIMAADPVSASPDTPVEEIAALMIDEMVRRVPVVEGGRVVGIVSASDIIQVFLNLHETARSITEEAERAVPQALTGTNERRKVRHAGMGRAGTSRHSGRRRVPARAG